MRRTFHELLYIGHAAQRVLDNIFVFMREPRFSAKLLNVIAISFSARDASRRSMRLLPKASVGQISHNIADGRRAQALTAATRKGARAHRLSRGDECLDDGSQDFAFPIAGWSWWHVKIRVRR